MISKKSSIIYFLVILIIVSCGSRVYSPSEVHDTLIEILVEQDKNFSKYGKYNVNMQGLLKAIFKDKKENSKYCYLFSEKDIYPEDCIIFKFPQLNAYLSENSYNIVAYSRSNYPDKIYTLNNNGDITYFKFKITEVSKFNVNKLE
jgi:hypothetical protein